MYRLALSLLPQSLCLTISSRMTSSETWPAVFNRTPPFSGACIVEIHVAIAVWKLLEFHISFGTYSIEHYIHDRTNFFSFRWWCSSCILPSSIALCSMQIAKTKAFQQQRIWVSSYLFSWYSHLNFLGIWFNIWKKVQQIQIFFFFSPVLTLLHYSSVSPPPL